MRIETKILIIFLLVILFSVGRSISTQLLQNRILENTLQINDVEAPLEVMAERNFGLGVMLIEEVHGALLHAQQDEYKDVAEHRINYNQLVEQERQLRQEQKIIISNSKISEEIKHEIEEQSRIIEEYNPKMVELELKGFDLIEKKEAEEANDILVGGDHKVYKAKLFEAYRTLADLQHVATLKVSKEIIKDSRILLRINMGISLVIIIFIILALLVVRSFVLGKEQSYDFRNNKKGGKK